MFFQIIDNFKQRDKIFKESLKNERRKWIMKRDLKDFKSKYLILHDFYGK